MRKFLLRFCIILSSACLAGNARAGEADNKLAAGGTVAVYNTANDGLLTDRNTQFGKNLTIDSGSVNALLEDVGLSGLGGVVDIALSAILGPLGIEVGIGGDGELGGGGGLGITADTLAMDGSELTSQDSSFTVGSGTLDVFGGGGANALLILATNSDGTINLAGGGYDVDKGQPELSACTPPPAPSPSPTPSSPAASSSPRTAATAP